MHSIAIATIRDARASRTPAGAIILQPTLGDVIPPLCPAAAAPRRDGLRPSHSVSHKCGTSPCIEARPIDKPVRTGEM